MAFGYSQDLKKAKHCDISATDEEHGGLPRQEEPATRASGDETQL